ncbi:serine hydrolase domain-containing protein [Paenibacillus eucommiae]|uniref:CubicO group peptidase (Beta-lactamase class C family) n=1 Tax=Paenibacillus eucommiae TaxID=1355755 RepID=A0ABS4J4W7_9BACL|nr:serine hydrolase domain-containing protein [Paenibacillus eucommiae]MBP1994880.1 CubicO group peptidase (beta-lactamase class C family) [Paenibacillus eucommiae]
MKNEQFAPLLSYVQHTQQDVGSSAAALIVIQDDKIASEWYNGSHHFKSGAREVSAASLFNLYSARKTYVGLATAIAIVEGNLNIDTPVYAFIDDIPPDELGAITLRHLATKTGAKYFGKNRIEREELAGKVIERITGFNIAELITRKVLQPMQLSETEWVTAPKENLVCDFQAGDGYASVRIESNEGHERNLYTSTRDFGFWGYLHLKKGFINGTQLLPVEVFELFESLKAEEGIEKRILGWYYQQDWYYATGAAGCHCVVVPEFNAVGVRMYNKYTDNYKEDQAVFNSTLLNCLKSR